MLDYDLILTHLIAWEGFIALSYHKSFESYIAKIVKFNKVKFEVWIFIV